jgi:hypothetical protein
MLLIAAAAAAALSTPEPPRRPGSATAQAQAIVRIVSGVRLRLDGRANDGAPPARDAYVRIAGALLQPARLIEFE